VKIYSNSEKPWLKILRQISKEIKYLEGTMKEINYSLSTVSRVWK